MLPVSRLSRLSSVSSLRSGSFRSTVLAAVLALAIAPLFVGCGDDLGKGIPDGPVSTTDGGGGSSGNACTAIFLTPAAMAALKAADDKDKDGCVNGFQTDVRVGVTGPGADTASVTLLVGGAPAGAPVVVAGGSATFANV